MSVKKQLDLADMSVVVYASEELVRSPSLV